MDLDKTEISFETGVSFELGGVWYKMSGGFKKEVPVDKVDEEFNKMRDFVNNKINEEQEDIYKQFNKSKEIPKPLAQ
jgi:hypothetical protein